VRAGRKRTEREIAAQGAVSQNSAVLNHVEVDVILGELDTGRIHHGRAAPGVKRSGFPRKEVIQPQLPLRLPCYDFTPVTNPTFDGSLPCGLGHRLRVLPASVV
jgi:hypothetical protein